MHYNIKPKPTRYKGTQYRSRLEAKWAAFFDKIGWRYTYEPFDMGEWSPDFLLNDGDGNKWLVEIKPSTLIDIALHRRLLNASLPQRNILILSEELREEYIPNAFGVAPLTSNNFNYMDEGVVYPEFTYSLLCRINISGQYCVMDWDEFIDADFEKEYSLPNMDRIEMMWRAAGNEVQWKS